MQQPADVDRQLRRLGARQQHAVVERVQEARVADPASLLHQLAMHQRDLPGRSAEAQQPDPRPDPGGLAQGGLGLDDGCWLRRHSGILRSCTRSARPILCDRSCASILRDGARLPQCLRRAAHRCRKLADRAPHHAATAHMVPIPASTAALHADPH
jgi:hypothetical protein